MVFQREYNISRESILLEYSWDDIQSYVHNLPIEKIITLYEGKKADNSNRYLESLCDRDIVSAAKDLDEAERAFRERRARRK